MKIKELYFTLLSLLLSIITNAQVKIGETGTPVPSAVLELTSTKKGLLIPRMTGTQRISISSPAQGLMIYQTTDTVGVFVYTKKGWQLLNELGSSTLQNTTSGNYSIAMGLANTASGSYSVALGGGNTASGDYSTSLGAANNSTGLYSTSMGYAGKAEGISSISMGHGAYALADYSVAIGRRAKINNTTHTGSFVLADGTDADFASNTTNQFKARFNGGYIFYTTAGVAMGHNSSAAGDYSIAMGNNNLATGNYSIAMGYNTTTSGNNSTALGSASIAAANYSVVIGRRAKVNNTAHTGSFVLADGNNSDVVSTAANELSARFSGGFRFYTNAALTNGVFLTADDNNGWTAFSDSSKKENFVKANPEEFLQKLRRLRLGSWNYKMADSKKRRHYGPMAQEIFAAFGKDEYGTIGSDTLLATGDMDGIMMIALQGLEKRTTEQKQENAQLKTQISKMNEDLVALKKENTELKTQLAKINALQQQLAVLQEQIKTDKKSSNVYHAVYKN